MAWQHKPRGNLLCSGACISLLLLYTGKALRHGEPLKKASWPWFELINPMGLTIGLWSPASEVLHWFVDLLGRYFPLDNGQTPKALP